MKRRSSRRLIYQNWVTDIAGYTPVRDKAMDSLMEESDERSEGKRYLIEEAVRKALNQLPIEERELVERVQFMGESFQSISERSGRKVYRLEALYGRAQARLRKILAGFVGSMFGVEETRFPNCPLCRSEWRHEIDRIIARKCHDRNWKEVMATIRRRFGIVVRAPQILIGHRKYHN